MFTTSAPRITVRFVALLTAVSLVLSAFPAAFFVANAEDTVPPVDAPANETPADEVPNNAEEPVAKAAALIVEDEPVEAAATIVATKIICDDESKLPNWGSTTENPDITADTAEDWIAEHEGCFAAKGWEFQWAPYGSTGNPGDTLVGEADAPWNTFSYSTTIPESAFETGVWVREVLQAGYIPFTYNPEKSNEDTVSAEIYCNADVLNYDNIDYVGGIEAEGTYYCVAWNVLAEEPEPTETITACKLDENKNPVAGWEMAVTNYEGEGDDYYELVTGEDGCVSIEVNPEFGPWLVMEEVQEGWSQVDVLATNGEVYSYEEDDYSFCVFFDYRAEARVLDSSESQGDMDPSYTCTFINDGPDVVEEPEKPRKNGSSGTRTKRAPQGQVLGATTQCGLWLEDYMQKATENDTYQVLKLQVFLTLQGFATPLTGIFDATTEANVKLFQTKYADTVIKPWFEKGIVPHNRPTGFVYKTTRWQINDIMCPGIEAYPSFDGENLSTNVLISR